MPAPFAAMIAGTVACDTDHKAFEHKLGNTAQGVWKGLRSSRPGLPSVVVVDYRRSGAWTNSGTGINSNGLDDTRGCYQEALSIFVKLSHGDNKYAGPLPESRQASRQ